MEIYSGFIKKNGIIDLHGLNAKDALKVTEHFINIEIAKNRDALCW